MNYIESLTSTNRYLIYLLFISFIFLIVKCTHQKSATERKLEREYERNQIVSDSILESRSCVSASLNPDSFDTRLERELPSSRDRSLKYKYEINGVLVSDLRGLTYSNFGEKMTQIGDANGDGVGEILISSYLANRVCMYSGSDLKPIGEVDDPNVTEQAYGSALAGTDDVDGDDVPDFLVGAKAATPDGEVEDQGLVYLFSGADLSLIRTLESPNPTESQSFGSDIENVGDTNGDGISDILISAQGGDRVYLFNGSSFDLLHEFSWPNDKGAKEGRVFGAIIEGVGDATGDSLSDFIISSQPEMVGGSDYEGAIYMYNGSSGDALKEFSHSIVEGNYGNSITGIGDVNMNGCKDFVVWDKPEMMLYDSCIKELLVNPLNHVGSSATGVKGLSGDKGVDLVLGNSRYTADIKQSEYPGEHAGSISIYRGREFINAKRSQMKTVQQFRSPNPQERGFFGLGVENIGDINNDGVDDIMVSAPSERIYSSEVGRVYVFTSKRMSAE